MLNSGAASAAASARPPFAPELKGRGGMDHLAVGFELKAAGDGEPEGTFEGYGAVFGNEDKGGDLILKGAFKKSLAEWKRRKALPKMLFAHGFESNGSLPIGVWTSMEEDDHGLKVKGRLIALDTDRGKTILAGLKEGALDGLSIGYRAKEFVFGTKPDEPWRTIKQLDLFEVSVVLFGMNDQALVTGVKGAELPTEREMERLLMRDAGLSAIEAKTLLASGYKSLKGARDAAGDDDDRSAAADLQQLAQLLRG